MSNYDLNCAFYGRILCILYMYSVYVFNVCILRMYSIVKIRKNRKLSREINENQAAKPEFHNFNDRFKSCFDTARL